MGFLDRFRRKVETAVPEPASERRRLMVHNPDGSHMIHAKVIGALHPGLVTVRIGTGSGMLNGGIDLDVPIELIPIELRMPNSEFMLIFDATQKPSDIERIANPWFGAGNV